MTVYVLDLEALGLKWDRIDAETVAEKYGLDLGSFGVKVEVMVETEYTAYDRGDLCSDIDRALGDVIERFFHRHMPRGLSREERKDAIGYLADRIIEYDKGSSNITET